VANTLRTEKEISEEALSKRSSVRLRRGGKNRRGSGHGRPPKCQKRGESGTSGGHIQRGKGKEVWGIVKKKGILLITAVELSEGEGLAARARASSRKTREKVKRRWGGGGRKEGFFEGR